MWPIRQGDPDRVDSHTRFPVATGVRDYCSHGAICAVDVRIRSAWRAHPTSIPCGVGGTQGEEANGESARPGRGGRSRIASPRRRTSRATCCGVSPLAHRWLVNDGRDLNRPRAAKHVRIAWSGCGPVRVRAVSACGMARALHGRSSQRCSMADRRADGHRGPQHATHVRSRRWSVIGGAGASGADMARRMRRDGWRDAPGG